MNRRIAYFSLTTISVVSLGYTLFNDPLAGFPWSVAGLAALFVGAVLAWKVPSNPLSWLLLAFGSASVMSSSAVILLETIEDQDVAGLLDAGFNAVNTAGVLLFPIVLLRFPDGHVPSSRWRFVEWLAITGACVGAAAALLNGGWGGDPGQALVQSPLREQTEPLGDVLSSIFYPLFAASFVGAAWSLISRYRRSSGDVRLQFRWLAYSAGYLVVGLGAILASSGFAAVATDRLWEQILMALAFTFIPVSIGIAVLKYRLYDVDVVISRTLVLAILASFITLTYAAIVVGVGQLIGGDSRSVILPIAATALVAIAFEPVRVVAQRWANRLVYGNRATPYEVLSELTERLARGEEREGLLGRMSGLLRDGTGADRATVWLGATGSMTAAATTPAGLPVTGQPTLDGEVSFPVLHDGELVGALEVVKARGSLLSSSERHLISDLAGSAGAVLGFQKLNDSLERRAVELEESRSRLVGAQDQERRRLERELHEGAEQFIVALKVKIGVASQLADQHGAVELRTLLEGLTGEAQAALDDVQSLAKGIYPPILESDGLAAAISALANSTPVDVEFDRDGIGRYPADIEAAVYFDVSEAVTNAVKHAIAPIRIQMSDGDGILRFSITDSGPGFEMDRSRMGSGMENMVDRLDAIGGSLEVTASVGKPTRIEGTVPLPSVAG